MSTKKLPTWLKTIGAIWRYLGIDRRRFIGAVCITLINTLLTIGLTILIGYAVGDVFEAFDRTKPNPTPLHDAWRTLVIYSAGLLAGYLLYFALYLTSAKLIIRTAFNLGYHVRELICLKFARLPYATMLQQASGDVMARATLDVNALAVNMSISVTNMFVAPILVFGVTIGLFFLSPYLALITLLMFLLSGLWTAILARKSAPNFRQMQHTLGDMNALVEEQMANRKVIRLFSLQASAHHDFVKANTKQRNVSNKAECQVNYIFPVGEFIENATLGVLYFVAVYLAIFNKGSGSVITPKIDVATVTAFVLLARQANGESTNALRMIGWGQRMLVAAERCMALLDLPEMVDSGTKTLTKPAGRVDFEHVTFGYAQDKPVLRDVSFVVPAGTTLAVVGPTGSGKTTLISLLLRFFDVQTGTIKIDGVDIRTVCQTSLNANIAVVLQDSFLFSETIRENIRYGNKNATDAQIVAAAKAANAHTFISSLPNGYDTVVSARDNDFSAGQIQMLALARAFLSPAPILILDEATSCVDTKTEKDIQDAMLRLMRDRTVIVIAHRLSTILHAQQILVMRDGQIIERGTHEDLLALAGFYARLYRANITMADHEPTPQN